MIEPVLVLVDLAPHGGEVGLLDPLGDGTRPPGADLAVVDGTDRDHFGRRAREEGFFGQVEVGADDGLVAHLDPEVAGNPLPATSGSRCATSPSSAPTSTWPKKPSSRARRPKWSRSVPSTTARSAPGGRVPSPRGSRRPTSPPCGARSTSTRTGSIMSTDRHTHADGRTHRAHDYEIPE